MKVNEDALRETEDSVGQRYRFWLLDNGHRHDAVEAILAERGYDPHLAHVSLGALERWLARPDWETLLDSYARCVRIARDQQATRAIQKGLLCEPAEVALYEAYARVAPAVIATPSVDTFLGALLELKPAIARFFDEVLVMDQDQAVRNNRLALMQAIRSLADGIVDLTVMEGF